MINSFLKRRWSPLGGSHLIGADTNTKRGRRNERRGRGEKGEKDSVPGCGEKCGGQASETVIRQKRLITEDHFEKQDRH